MNKVKDPIANETRKAEMIRLRTEERLTLQQIANRYGITRERVRQIIGNTGHMKLNSK